MVKRGHIFLVLLLLCFKAGLSQDTLTPATRTDDNDIQQQLENIAENSQDEEADYSNLLDALQLYREHPINLNSTTKEELEQLQLLNDIQINNLLQHIKHSGKLITIYELQSIEGFDLRTIQKILPYVMVTDNFNSSHFSIHEMFRSGSHAVVFRYGRILEEQKGFTAIDSTALYNSPNSRYIGSPDKLYLRYRFTYSNNVSWGITAEKDQGELFLKSNQRFKYDWYDRSLKGNKESGLFGGQELPGFDFYSAHLYFHNINKYLRSVALGDFQATFGQGLTMWSGYSFGKGADIMGTKKSAGGIKPYSSVDENRFLRGAAITAGIKKFEATAFCSYKRVDANVSDTLPDGEVAEISSLQETGYHTTASEIADKHAISQTIYGGNIAYKGQAFSIGITGTTYQLSKDFHRDLSYYNQFDINSKNNSNIGLDYNFILRNFNFFGEEAMSANGGTAFLNGVLVSLDPRLSFTALHRYYGRNYQNLLSNGFAESTTPANEKGLYIGMVAKPLSQFTLTVYFDRFEFPWMRYQVDAPSTGTDYSAQLNYTPSKKFDAYFRIRSRSKFKNSSAEDLADVDYLVPYEQTNYRLNTSFSILPSVKLKNRIELIDFKVNTAGTEKGFMAYQDVTFAKLGKPFSFTLRYALFQTDSYDARIYTYENDVPGAYSIPSFYDRGSRFYLLLDYNITRKIEVWLRYSQTVYDNKKIISEGSLTEIDGNTKSELKVQLRVKF